MGLVLTRDSNELTRLTLTVWGDKEERVLEEMGETIAELIPHGDSILLTEEHMITEEYKIDVLTEFIAYIKDFIEDGVVPTLFQLNLHKNMGFGQNSHELFILTHMQSVLGKPKIIFESVKWWDEPRKEVEVVFKLWDAT